VDPMCCKVEALKWSLPVLVEKSFETILFNTLFHTKFLPTPSSSPLHLIKFYNFITDILFPFEPSTEPTTSYVEPPSSKLVLLVFPWHETITIPSSNNEDVATNT